MNSFKQKTKSFFSKTKGIGSFFAFLKNKIFKCKKSSLSVDQKLVFSLSPKKIPSSRQLKYISKFLKPKEWLIIKISFLVIVVSFLFLGVNFLRKHLEYKPVYGGEYIEGSVSYPKTINPLYAVNRDIDGDLSRLIYSSLFFYENGELKKDLVEDYSIVNDKEYVFYLRNDVKWHNGDRLTSDDVVFTIETIKNEDYHSPLKSIFNDTEIEILNEFAVKITLNSPYAPFLSNLTFGILPQSVWGKTNADTIILSEANLKPLGSGPYKFKSLTKDKDGNIREYELAVNDNYYLDKPFIKTLKFKFFINYPEAIRALNNNQINGLSFLPLNERSELIAKDSFLVYELSRPQIVGLFFNFDKNKALENKTTRASLAQAINKEEIIREVFLDIYQLEDGPLLNNNYAFNEEIERYNFEPMTAKDELEGKLASTSITVIDSGRNVLVAEKIKNFWESVGVETELIIIPGEKAAEVIKNRDFEIILYGETVGADPDIYAFWHSSQAKSGGLNIAGYKNTEADELLLAGRETLNREDRIEIYKKLQENIVSNIPAVFLYSPSYTYIQSKKVRGFSLSSIIEPSDRFADISTWYLKTKTRLVW